MAEQIQGLIGNTAQERAELDCNKSIKEMVEQLLGSSYGVAVEHALPDREAALALSYFPRRIQSIGHMLLCPGEPIRKTNGYEAIPWPVYVTRDYECLASVTVGAMQIPCGSRKKPDQQHGVFVKFYWSAAEGEVIETLCLETFESRNNDLPHIGSIVEWRSNSDEDFQEWRKDWRQACDVSEVEALLHAIQGL